mmetsp:Transcript_38445/g.108644  ORF Transcript_38445/g.108644 Transcript_38445/m.108644 type:complete len:921 (-) Transcript_38445:261-3023(-)|eukprot:CAMPEP_0117649518 /NCGR_PEP_ID=MMETSP0804-20121206/1016_1 /TAXON_ID=1074897 /ORGANISM="Tetraselmis astigmatica, Strain CCMP880" /LENGTH=920 /DNA_ID=CAMNT_0005455263 /DNA_START=264 /DNA_END=3026 /DNA_ORIENTATION=+
MEEATLAFEGGGTEGKPCEGLVDVLVRCGAERPAGVGDDDGSRGERKEQPSRSACGSSEPGSTEALFSAAAAAQNLAEALPSDPDQRHAVVRHVSCVNGRSLLHLAAEAGDEERVKLLLSNQAQVNAKGRDDATALHLAAASGNWRVVRTLVRYGGGMDIKAPGGWTPLHLAVQNGHREAADYLSANGSNIHAVTQFKLTPLHLAAWHGHRHIAGDLIWRGAKLTRLDNNRRTPLHLACWAGHSLLVKLLVTSGASMSAVDVDGSTPLHDAALNNSAACIRSLAPFNPPWEKRNKLGKTALHEAVSQRYRDAVKELLEHADVNAGDFKRCTSLHLAVLVEDLQTIDMLLATPSIDVNRPAADGSTPLHWAVWHGLPEIVDRFLKAGADSTLTDKDGNTPLLLAAFQGNTTIADRLLQESTLPLTQLNESGKCPMDLAREFSHYECGALLLSYATGEAFTPLVPQRLCRAQNLLEFPVVAGLSASFQRTPQSPRSFGPQWMNQSMEGSDRTLAAFQKLQTMKAPVYGIRKVPSMSSDDSHHLLREATPPAGAGFQQVSPPVSHHSDDRAALPLPSGGRLSSSSSLSSLQSQGNVLFKSESGEACDGSCTRPLSLLAPQSSWRLEAEDLDLFPSGEGGKGELGRGPWGPVYRGLMHGTDLVAVRKFPLLQDPELLAAAVRHLDHLQTLRHPSLVMFLGAAFFESQLWIVSEIINGGTLECKVGSPTWDLLMHNAVLSCARALNYLHHQRPPVVHGNVCPASVLLADGTCQQSSSSPSAGPTAKLVGLKMLALEDLAAESSMGVGASEFQVRHQPACHLVPEVADGAAPTPAADVYCLGRLMMELAGRAVHPDNHLPMDTDIGAGKATAAGQFPLSEGYGSKLDALMRWCLQPSPAARPAACDVVQALQAALRDEPHASEGPP